MKQPATLVFVCQNLRDPDAPQGSCMRRGSKAVLERMKAVRGELGLKGELRVMGATCLGCCESGVTVLCVDEQAGATFYGRMDPELGEALIRHKHANGPDTALEPHRLRPDDLLDLSALEAAKP
jgi:predicted metal-binding protein